MQIQYIKAKWFLWQALKGLKMKNFIGRFQPNNLIFS
jgi:hypothetical protein